MIFLYIYSCGTRYMGDQGTHVAYRGVLAVVPQAILTLLDLVTRL